ncbi:hypothetical protein SAMN04515674_11872 [Pseudarcicella hirudinis]|uniref:Uncharacterized protein n=1 Tax=Pseudarcicella hirudinis TaxID=1079859 RepID=A0A1I5YEN8_9BACT|nr:hypothetical protein [Pseudarcicella hirudinis]SFQ42705.1 hypothetical protein SAMN04515674_11872 [Pseudarcicella hirudinis]
MTQSSQAIYLLKDLYVTKEEVEIIDSLVDSQQMFYDFSKNKVVSFIQETDFHLVIYNADENDKGFTMYIVKDFCNHEEELVYLRNIFQALVQQGVNIHTMRAARSKVEDIFYMLETFRALFHKQKSSDDSTPYSLPDSIMH